MTNELERLCNALQQSMLFDQNSLNEATDYIVRLRCDPNGLFLFFEIVKLSQDFKIRYAAITNVLPVIKMKKMWASYSNEVRRQIQSYVLEILQMDNITKRELEMMADLSAFIFSYVGFWNEMIQLICISYQKQNIYLAMLLLSRIFPVMPEQIIKESYNAFRNMALVGLDDDDLHVSFNASTIFIKIGKVIDDLDVLEPFISFLFERIESSLSYNDDDFSTFWGFISKFISFQQTTYDVALQFLQVSLGLVQNESVYYERRHRILDSFISIIPKLSQELIHTMISISLSLAIKFIQTEEQQPYEYLTIVEKVLSVRDQDSTTELLKENIMQMLNSGNLSQLVLGVSVLQSLLIYAEGPMSNELELIHNILSAAIANESDILKISALKVIATFDETFDGISELSVDLMKEIIGFLISPENEIRIPAYWAFQTLCEICDTEIEGLFGILWKYQVDGNIRPNEFEYYITILSHALLLSTDVDDDMLNSIIPFIDRLVSSSEIYEKSAALKIITSLLAKRESLIVQLLYKALTILDESFQIQNDNVLCHALLFINNLAKTFRKEILKSIQPYFDIISKLISENNENQVFYQAINAAASIIMFCGDSYLMNVTCQYSAQMLESSSEQVMTDGCLSIAMISKTLSQSNIEGNVQTANTLLYGITSIILEQTDLDLIEAAIEAASKIFKNFHKIAPNIFIPIGENLINQLFNGQIAFFSYEPEYIFNCSSDLILYILNFISVYMCSNPPNLSEICNFLLKWIHRARHDIITSILGAVAGALKEVPLDIQFLNSLIQFLYELIPTVTNVTLRHNICYFTNIFIKQMPDQIQNVINFIPYFKQWWDEGKTKSSGYQQCFSNIAVDFLRYFTNNVSIETERICDAIKAFPPADMKESNNMGQLLILIFSNQQPIELILAFVEAVFNLLCEPLSKKSSRKLDEKVELSLKSLFHSFIQNEQIRNHLFSIIGSNQYKQQIFYKYL